MKSDSTLEERLTAIQSTAESCRKSAVAYLAAIKSISEAASSGDMRTLARITDKVQHSLSEMNQAFDALNAQRRANQEGFSKQAFVREMLDAADKAGVRILVQGERLYCPPFEIGLSEDGPAVLIGKRRIDTLRPSIVIEEIKRVQQKASRFKPDEFLEILWAAYVRALGPSPDLGRPGIVPLNDIYELLTLLPGTSKDYTSDDFARDIYLLDRSGTAQARRTKGGKVRFIASSGTRSSKVLTVMSDDGMEQKYYAISFSAGE